MKKHFKKKLVLNKKTISYLNNYNLQAAIGTSVGEIFCTESCSLVWRCCPITGEE